jgi:hypothetical protein
MINQQTKHPNSSHPTKPEVSHTTTTEEREILRFYKTREVETRASKHDNLKLQEIHVPPGSTIFKTQCLMG